MSIVIEHIQDYQQKNIYIHTYTHRTSTIQYSHKAAAAATAMHTSTTLSEAVVADSTEFK